MGGLNLVDVDYNNDGHLDILGLHGVWLADQGRHPNSLLSNNGPDKQGVPKFTYVTAEAGLKEKHFPRQTADWADYDLDVFPISS